MANSKKSKSTRSPSLSTLFPQDTVRVANKRIASHEWQVVLSCSKNGSSWSDLLEAAKGAGASIGWGKLHKMALWMYSHDKSAKFAPVIGYICGLYLQILGSTTDPTKSKWLSEVIAMADGSYTAPVKAEKVKRVSARDQGIGDWRALLAARAEEAEKAKAETSAPVPPADAPADAPVDTPADAQSATARLQLMLDLTQAGWSREDILAALGA